MKRIKKWFEDNRGLVSDGAISFCIGTAVTFWTAMIVAAIKGLKLVWIPRK